MYREKALKVIIERKWFGKMLSMVYQMYGIMKYEIVEKVELLW